MPIDPNISLAVTPPRGADILQPYMQAQEVQRNALALQTQSLQNQQQLIDFQDQMTMRQMLPQLIQEHQGDWEKAFSDPRLLSSVSPKTALPLQQLALDRMSKMATYRKTVADTNKTVGETAQTHLDFLGDTGVALLQGAGGDASKISPAAFEAALNHLADVDRGNSTEILAARDRLLKDPSSIGPEVRSWIYASPKATENYNRILQSTREQDEAQRKAQAFPVELAGKRQTAIKEAIAAVAQGIGTVKDQQGYEDLIKNSVQGAPDVEAAVRSRLPVRFTPDVMEPIREQTVPPDKLPEYRLAREKQVLGMFGTGEWDQFLAKNALAKGKTPATLTAPEFNALMQQYKEMNQDPVLRGLAISQKMLAETMSRAQMSQLPTEEDLKEQARALISGEMSPDQIQALRSRAGGSKVFTYARQMDPKWDMAQAEVQYKNRTKTEEAFSTGKQADLVRSNNNAMEHLAMLNDARIALKNGDIQAMNRVANFFGVQTGSDLATTFDHIASRVGDEVTKAFVPGGGGVAERVAAAGGYKSSMGDQQLESNIKTDLRLMDSQQRNLQQQYQRGTYGRGKQQLFTDEALAARDRVLGTQRPPAAQSPATLPPPPPGKIRVISPEGVPGYMDWQKWPEAEKRGFKRL